MSYGAFQRKSTNSYHLHLFHVPANEKQSVATEKAKKKNKKMYPPFSLLDKSLLMDFPTSKKKYVKMIFKTDFPTSFLSFL